MAMRIRTNEAAAKKYTLLDKQRDPEDDYKYVPVFGPTSKNDLKGYMAKFCTKSFDETPLNPAPADEPEEGFIIVST